MGKPLIPAQRRERIQEYLAVHQIARIADLCALLETSEATIRRDLEWLEAEGILERTHGGAIVNQRLTSEPEYLLRVQKNPEEKRQIGALAASLIEDGDIVFINSGTTTTQVIQQIRSNANISVFTNNLNAALELGVQAGQFEFQMLYGIRRDLQEKLAKDGYPVRIYVPFGKHWYPYYMRRLAERPANIWFFISNFFRR